MRDRFALVTLSAALLVAGLWTACQPDDPDPDAEVVLGGPGGTPGVIEQTVLEGGPNPADLTIQVTNGGTCDLDVAASATTVDGLGWLGVTYGGGDILADASAPITVSIDVVTPGLVAGTYTGTVAITGVCVTNGVPALGSPATVAVNLTVTPNRAAITVDDDRLEQDVVSIMDDTTSMSTLRAPSPRSAYSAVWTGMQMLVWGGLEAAGTATDTGGLYEPLTDTWTATALDGAPSPRFGHVAVWTGTEMVIWGGFLDPDNVSADGAAYDPGTGTWRALPSLDAPQGASGATAVWTGAEVIVWGGGNELLPVSAPGARYDPVANTWSPMATDGAPEARRYHGAVWTGTEMLVWGGRNAALESLDTGARYAPISDTWSPMSTIDAPAARGEQTMLWTGKELLVWESSNSVFAATGGAYDPVTDTWRPLRDVEGNAPSDCDAALGVWTGARMLTLCRNDDGSAGAGATYDPGVDTGNWSPLPGAPYPTDDATAVWTGTDLILWGGQCPSSGTPPCTAGETLDSGVVYH